jgi:echinoderm microtubule-associated protein-like 6
MDNNKSILYSAGMDGKVLSWGYQNQNDLLIPRGEIVDLSKINPPLKAGITAMDINEKTGVFLLGTSSA